MDDSSARGGDASSSAASQGVGWFLSSSQRPELVVELKRAVKLAAPQSCANFLTYMLPLATVRVCVCVAACVFVSVCVCASVRLCVSMAA